VTGKIASIHVAPWITLYHTGPPLDYGPLPSFFYFALSGPDSLTRSPYNQPVQFLRGQAIRIFSMTLPGHENNLPIDGAMRLWAEEFSRGKDPLDSFLDSVKTALDFAIREKFINEEKLGVGGLSRGGFIAAHVAAREEKFRFLLTFAPLTRLSLLKEFASLQDHPLVLSYDVERLSEALHSRSSRFYIGNRDTRVGTKVCFDCAMGIVEAAHEKRIRTPQVECIVTPSIGKDGHGTSPEVFQQGAKWLAESLHV
jgi:prolyl oligopeptidase family protein